MLSSPNELTLDLIELCRFERPVSTMGISPDGSTVFAAGLDTTAKLFDLETGEIIVDLGKRRKPVLSVAFAPRGDNTFTINGMTFPKRASTGAMGKLAEVYATSARRGQWQRQLTLRWKRRPPGQKESHIRRNDALFTAVVTWVISSYSLTDGSESGSSRVLTAIPGGYSFLTSSQYEKTYESLREGVLKMNILDKYKADIDSKLKSFTKNYSSYSQSLSASNGTVSLYVQLQAKGRFNGRSWYKGTVGTVETCAPPEISDVTALKQSLQNWIAATVDALPYKGKPVIIFKPGDISTAPKGVFNNKLQILTNPQLIVTNPQPTPSPTPR